MSAAADDGYALPRRVLLTGGSRGIGRAIAQQLRARGCTLALVGRDEAALRAVADEARGDLVLRADLSDADAGLDAAREALDRLGGLDAFVASAGVALHAPVGAISEEALQHQLQLNFTTQFLMAQQVGVAMAAAGGGRIVLVTSTLAHAPAALTAAYAASKAALGTAARALALELGPRGVRINTVAPGVVDTDMVRALRPGPDGRIPLATEAAVAAQLQTLAALHPLGRLGLPDDVAEAVLYLLCAPYVTGTVLTIDGGLSLGSGRM